MKKNYLFILCFLPFSAICQVVLPQSFLKKTIEKNFESKHEGALVTGKIEDKKFYWFPTIKYLKIFEEQKAKFMQNNIISYNDSLSNIALYSEIASDYIGPVRVSAGLTFAYPKTDTNTVKQQKINREKFIQRLSTGGGSVALNFTLPIYTYNTQIFGTTLSTGPRISLDPPSFGVSSNKFISNLALSTDLQAELRGIKEVFKFIGAARISYLSGNSSFYNALELTNANRKGFWLNNYTLGVNVKDIFTLSYTKFWGSRKITDKLSNYLTFTISPEFK